MARKGRVSFVFECRDCKEKTKLTLYFGLKKIWNNSTSPTLQKLYAHQKHKVSVQYLFEPHW